MPTVAIIGPYRFFFYSSDAQEPYHIHVMRDAAVAKFWLAPIRLADASAFSRSEIRRLTTIVEANADRFQEKWHEYFGT